MRIHTKTRTHKVADNALAMRLSHVQGIESGRFCRVVGRRRYGAQGAVAEGEVALCVLQLLHMYVCMYVCVCVCVFCRRRNCAGVQSAVTRSRIAACTQRNSAKKGRE
jgi:hypothetical protein